MFKSIEIPPASARHFIESLSVALLATLIVSLFNPMRQPPEEGYNGGLGNQG